MATAFTIRPASQGTYSQWILGPGGSKPSAMSDASDATYIVTDQFVTWADSYVMQDLPAEAGVIVGDVVYHCRNVYTGDPVSGSSRLRYNSTDSDSGISWDVVITEKTVNYALAPGSVAWTPAILNATEAGVVATTGTLDFAYCYDIWLTGNWDLAPSGGFVFLLGLAGIMALQMVGPMTDYTQFEKFLQSRANTYLQNTILTADEKLTAWNEYRSYKAPRFFYG